MPPLPADLAVALAAIATLVSNILRSDGLPRWINMLIAGIAFVIETGATLWLTSGFSGSAKDVVAAFLTLAVALAYNELSALLDYIKNAPSPLANPSKMDTQPMPVARRTKHDNAAQ